MVQNNFNDYIIIKIHCEGTIESDNLIVIHVVKKICFLLSELCPSQPSSCTSTFQPVPEEHLANVVTS
jgi:hypothetical protein